MNANMERRILDLEEATDDLRKSLTKTQTALQLSLGHVCVTLTELQSQIADLKQQVLTLRSRLGDAERRLNNP